MYELKDIISTHIPILKKKKSFVDENVSNQINSL